MTQQKTFKRRVRARMVKTGESYTAARRMLIAKGDAPEPAAADFRPPVSEERLVAATGRGWRDWIALLDEWGARDHTHPEIVSRLTSVHAVAGWYAQSITVGYERARGMRAVGQHADGWAITATRTVAVPVERLYEAFTDATARERWAPGAELGERTATAPKSARYDWEDGTTRVVVGFEALADGRSRVALAHERLPDADAADAMKQYWRERIGALKALLEGAEA
jgi:uncharacterized protein YndB with AHSA1/START domain